MIGLAMDIGADVLSPRLLTQCLKILSRVVKDRAGGKGRLDKCRGFGVLIFGKAGSCFIADGPIMSCYTVINNE